MNEKNTSGVMGKAINEESATADQNLKRLAEASILSDFVRLHDGAWDCSGWHSLCQILEDEGYTPIDFEKVGLLLEDKRTEYFNG